MTVGTRPDHVQWTMRSPSTCATGARAERPRLLNPSKPRQGMQVEGLRMVSLEHTPVMAAEVVGLLASVPAGVVVDGTVGFGGHAEAILTALPRLSVLGLDRDPAAVAAASARLARFGSRATVRHARFAALAEETAGVQAQRVLEPSRPVAGVLLDLGVSSPQLDVGSRGFSFRTDGPLDMRMDPTTGAPVSELVNHAPEEVLRRLFAEHGEGRLAGRLARAVVRSRPLHTTGQLAAVVQGAVPAAVRRRGHPATRVFQALRGAVNDELDELARGLASALDLLEIGGRLLVLSYHSGEDRIVKRALTAAVLGNCTCPPGLPCMCGARPQHRLVFRGSRTPSAEEVADNRRSSSARLRAVERTAVRAP